MEKIMQIDIETYSEEDIGKCGVYKYVENDAFEVLLFAYAYNDKPVEVIDLVDRLCLPKQLLDDLQNPEIIKTAFNANFERVCLGKMLGVTLDPSQWRCTMVYGAELGMLASLDNLAKALKLKEKKDAKGKNLIKYFSVPCKPTKVNGGRTRNMPWHDEVKWQQFIEYCRQDVVVEREIRNKLSRFPVAKSEWELYALDQRINDRGVKIDTQIVENAIAINDVYRNETLDKMARLTGLANPNSIAQLKSWLEEKGVSTIRGLGKDLVPDMIRYSNDETVKKVLKCRQLIGKSSVSKYEAMKRSLTKDFRNRGVFQFYGAGTGRWAGRIFQPQNLPANSVPDIDLARKILKDNDSEMLEMMFGEPPFILSQLIRTAVIPSEGSRFIVADFSAIEARIIAWVADEKWVLDVFRGTGKIYEATAAQMFNIPVETIVKGHENYKYRKLGKVAQLACGYQGSVGAITSMDRNGEIPEDDKLGLVKMWRKANPNIVKLWYTVEKAAKKAIREKTTVAVKHGISYTYKDRFLFANLPSGRSLAYPGAKVEQDSLSYLSVGSDGNFKEIETYGGGLVENLVQAIARDCLALTMTRLDAAGFNICMHVHDEIVCDQPRGDKSLEEMLAIMKEDVPWAEGLPLKGAGFEGEFYKKD